MKKTGNVLLRIELLVIALMSLAAGYALLGARFFIPFGILLVLGIITVVIPRNFSFIFSFAAGLITLPAFMKLNSVKWWLFSPDRLNFCPTLNLPLALAIGLFVVCGGLFLSYLQPLHRELRPFQKEQAGDPQIRDYVKSQSLVTVSAVLICGFAGAVMVVILYFAQGSLTDWFKTIPWSLPVAGLVSLVILGLVIFWLVGSRKTTR